MSISTPNQRIMTAQGPEELLNRPRRAIKAPGACFVDPQAPHFFCLYRNTEEHGKRGHVGPDRLSLNPSQNRS